MTPCRCSTVCMATRPARLAKPYSHVLLRKRGPSTATILWPLVSTMGDGDTYARVCTACYGVMWLCRPTGGVEGCHLHRGRCPKTCVVQCWRHALTCSTVVSDTTCNSSATAMTRETDSTLRAEPLPTALNAICSPSARGLRVRSEPRVTPISV